MKTRIIFLDFDGVLNSVRTCAATQETRRVFQVIENDLKGEPIDSGFDFVAVNLIRRLAEITNAKIVISSAWRYSMSLRTMQNMFVNEFGWPTGDDQLVIDSTNRTDHGHRGEDIEDWIERNATGMFEYIIIDDSSDLLDHHFSRFVKIDAVEGFLYRDFEKALDLFYAKDNGIEL